MAQNTGKDLNLVKPEMTDNVEQTIPSLGDNMQTIDDEFTAHKAETASDATPPHGMGDAAAQDYEEGTFTPTIDFGGGTTGIAYSEQTGEYKKIGNVVYWQARIELSSKGTSTGFAFLGGLPFSTTNSLSVGSANSMFYALLDVPTDTIEIVLYPSSGRLLFVASRDNAGQTNLNDTSFNDTTVIRASGFYFL